jgi:hypothetical protein
MHEFASALRGMDLSSFEPGVDADAPEKSCRIAHDADVSRRCPIQDAIDYWNVGRSSPDTGSGGFAPGQDGHNIGT